LPNLNSGGILKHYPSPVERSGTKSCNGDRKWQIVACQSKNLRNNPEDLEQDVFPIGGLSECWRVVCGEGEHAT